MQDSVTDAVNTVACITDDYSRDCHYRGGKYHPFSCVFQPQIWCHVTYAEKLLLWKNPSIWGFQSLTNFYLYWKKFVWVALMFQNLLTNICCNAL